MGTPQHAEENQRRFKGITAAEFIESKDMTQGITYYQDLLKNPGDNILVIHQNTRFAYLNAIKIHKYQEEWELALTAAQDLLAYHIKEGANGLYLEAANKKVARLTRKVAALK
ncbi:hypothetical protein JKY72_05640 [Candidatus Gracilibacteria bacterium]|nr:hypothetical protein [Candidatus Gracilibacteria bacterium]